MKGTEIYCNFFVISVYPLLKGRQTKVMTRAQQVVSHINVLSENEVAVIGQLINKKINRQPNIY